MDTRFEDTELYVDPARVEELVRALHGDEDPPLLGQPAPLGFFMYVTTIGADVVSAASGFDPLRVLYGGTRLVQHASPLVGDRLTVEAGIAKRWEKETRGGTLRFVEVACDYVRDGQVLVEERTTVVERP
jgi:hypothetical protein